MPGGITITPDIPAAENRVNLRAQPWPIPRPSWRARRYCATTLTDKTTAFGNGQIQLAADHSDTPSPRRRLRRLAAGHTVTLNLLIAGRQSWCPPFPTGHPVLLTATTATSTAGGGPSTDRPLPLHELRLRDAQLLDPPERPVIPGLETWTLTTEQETGTATITGLLADLALLAAVAGWPEPQSVRAHRHAGAAGNNPGPQPKRPPIRPLGWVLLALGLALVAGSIAALALTDHSGPMASLGASAGMLMVAGLGLRRRPTPQTPTANSTQPPPTPAQHDPPQQDDRYQREGA